MKLIMHTRAQCPRHEAGVQHRNAVCGRIHIAQGLRKHWELAIQQCWRSLSCRSGTLAAANVWKASKGRLNMQEIHGKQNCEPTTCTHTHLCPVDQNVGEAWLCWKPVKKGQQVQLLGLLDQQRHSLEGGLDLQTFQELIWHSGHALLKQKACWS